MSLPSPSLRISLVGQICFSFRNKSKEQLNERRAGLSSTKLVIIEFFDTLREVNIYIRGIWELIWINFWYNAWFPSNALRLFHKSLSVCNYFSQISERLAWFDFEHRSKNLRCSEQRSKTLRCSERLRFLGASVECRVPKKWLKKSPIFRRSRFPNLHFYIFPRIRVGPF